MKINLDNIQAEAQQIEEQIKLDTAQNEEIKKLLKKHENDLKKFFTDSFPKGSVSEGNGGRQLTAKFGEIEVSMYLVPLRYAENGTASPSNTIDPYFSKKKSGNKVFSITLFDITNYKALGETSTNYEYRYKLKEQVQQCSYADIGKILQMVADS